MVTRVTRVGQSKLANDLLDAIKVAMQDDNVVAVLAKRIAAVVTETIATRVDAMEKSLRDKYNKI